MIKLVLARIYYMWGSLHRNFGNRSSFKREHRAAVKRFTKAYELDPNFREAKLDRAIIYYREMGEYEQARSDLDSLLADDPAYGPALLNRAMLAQEEGRYAAALKDLEVYIVLPEEDAEYKRLASRTAEVLMEIVTEMDSEEE